MRSRLGTFVFAILAILVLAFALRPCDAWAGAVQITNSTTAPVKIVDGAGGALGEVPAGGTVTLTVPDGAQVLSAMRPDGVQAAKVEILIGPGSAPKWEILDRFGTVEVRNGWSDSLTILVDGRPLADVAPHQTARLKDLRPGDRALTAMAGTETRATAVATLDPGGLFVWRLDPVGAVGPGVPMLRVSNFSGGPVDVYVAGQRRTRIAPGESAAMVGIPEGEVAVEARRPGGAVVASERLTFGPQLAQRWMVTGPDGGRGVVEVVNESASTVKVCVDGSFCLRVGARSKVEYDEIVPGHHAFQAFDFKDGHPIDTVEIDVGLGTPYRWVLPAQ